MHEKIPAKFSRQEAHEKFVQEVRALELRLIRIQDKIFDSEEPNITEDDVRELDTVAELLGQYKTEIEQFNYEADDSTLLSEVVGLQSLIVLLNNTEEVATIRSSMQ